MPTLEIICAEQAELKARIAVHDIKIEELHSEIEGTENSPGLKASVRTILKDITVIKWTVIGGATMYLITIVGIADFVKGIIL